MTRDGVAFFSSVAFRVMQSNSSFASKGLLCNGGKEIEGKNEPVLVNYVIQRLLLGIQN